MLERLDAIAPVTAVKGNVDEDEVAAYPEFATLQLNGWELLVTHVLGMPPKGKCAEGSAMQLLLLLHQGEGSGSSFCHTPTLLLLSLLQ